MRSEIRAGLPLVSHIGKVRICGFLEEETGDIRKEPFLKIWNTSKLFPDMRDLDRYNGKCGICAYRRVCSGCRARAFAVSDIYLAAEPFSTYEPVRKKEQLGLDVPGDDGQAMIPFLSDAHGTGRDLATRTCTTATGCSPSGHRSTELAAPQSRRFPIPFATRFSYFGSIASMDTTYHRACSLFNAYFNV